MQIENAIEKVEQLYESLAGSKAPPLESKAYAPIPPEKDPQRYVEEQLENLVSMLDHQTTGRANDLPFAPELCVWEGGKDTVLCVDLPGIPRDSINIDVSNGSLIVQGERHPPKTGKKQQLQPRWMERPVGTFRRVIPLPQGIDTENIAARLADGVLEIRLAKGKSETDVKHIAIT